jgi:hypothetical protein
MSLNLGHRTVFVFSTFDENFQFKFEKFKIYFINF